MSCDPIFHWADLQDNKFVKKETLELLEKAGAKEGLVGPSRGRRGDGRGGDAKCWGRR